MKITHKLALPAVGIALAFGGITAAPATALTAAPAQASSYSCSSGYFCIYNGWNGSGHRCQWKQRSVSNTANDCSWIRKGWKVRSVYNRTGHRVQYYTRDNYHNRVGSTASGHRGSLEGTYQIRSFRPQ
ncbi:peptidase inhibitor family I36 protein [Streptomyces sediminimaris]|uniref:peptidase inhibitor family I36 protein n=1 Tax=Streptomyces sediminimaris TaxID=3383721 RepID=UPI003999CE99